MKEALEAPSSIKHDKKRPSVLGRDEVKCLMKAPSLLKHPVLIGLLYGCRLCCFEVRHLTLDNLDFDCKMLHLRKGQGKQDPHVPLRDLLTKGRKTYVEAACPDSWIFNSKRPVEGRAGRHSTADTPRIDEKFFGSSDAQTIFD